MPKKTPENKGPEGKKSTSLVSLMSQSFQTTRRGGANAKPSATRKAFLKAYEQSFGNVSISCEIAGIATRTYYRWMKSTTPVNMKFQKKVLALRPVERQLDFTEGALMTRVQAGDMRAIELVLTTRGKVRGYGKGEKTTTTETLEVPNELLTKVAKGYMLWHDANPNATTEEKMRWLGAFAARANLPPAELEAAVEDLKEKG